MKLISILLALLISALTIADPVDGIWTEDSLNYTLPAYDYCGKIFFHTREPSVLLPDYCVILRDYSPHYLKEYILDRCYCAFFE
ncbi:hypothetical protein BS50DRAFT_568885 [Corynespora cassiicola Philippines]|uniref:Uncharacterized protein n=1 Tax=Corynespora cassiicola Philippines TaxID=1448308 RepID=A0A2T2P6K3_CORCC|nr:hypothetical protein BS50DRAFT_568885 [Corynespora cassiicola Philippines]